MAYYYKHPDLTLPEDGTVIWRYMDMWKFQSMIKENSIFFSRADKQTDDREGEYPEGMLAELRRKFGDGIPSDDGTIYTFDDWHARREIPSRLISCWSVGPKESQKKWTKYTASKESIAVCTTIGKLKKCFRDRVEPVVWIGKVRYGEEENRLPNSISKGNLNFWLYPFFAKQDTYRWENEVRAIINLARRKHTHSRNGCSVKADLQILVDSVWIHPQSPEALRGQVRTELAKCGFGNVEICQSPWDSLA